MDKRGLTADVVENITSIYCTLVCICVLTYVALHWSGYCDGFC